MLSKCPSIQYLFMDKVVFIPMYVWIPLVALNVLLMEIAEIYLLRKRLTCSLFILFSYTATQNMNECKKTFTEPTFLTSLNQKWLGSDIKIG